MERDPAFDAYVGKGCIRFPKQALSDLELVGDLVEAIGVGRGPVC